MRKIAIVSLVVLLASAATLVAEGGKKHVTDTHPKEVAKHVADLHDLQTNMASVSTETARLLHENSESLQRAQEEGRPLTESEKKKFEENMMGVQTAIEQQQRSIDTMNAITTSLSQMQRSIETNINQ
jgi:ABC-type transporter Mla subunit MlaD